jgi:hypothetical protein
VCLVNTPFPTHYNIYMYCIFKSKVLACDGIWNVLESEEVVEFILSALARTPVPSPGMICEEVINNCLAPDTEGDGSGCDNMTMMLIILPSITSPIAQGGSSSSSSSSSSLLLTTAAGVVETEEVEEMVGEKRVSSVCVEDVLAPSRKKITATA